MLPWIHMSHMNLNSSVNGVLRGSIVVRFFG